MTFDAFRAFQQSLLADAFHPDQSLELLQATKPDSLYETIKGVMHTPNVEPDVDRVRLTQRMFDVVALRHETQRLPTPLYLRLLLAYGPVLPVEALDRLMGEKGVFVIDMCDLNQTFNAYSHAASAININLRYPINPQAVRYMAQRLWGWFDFEDHLVRQASRCENSSIVGELLEFEPFAEQAKRIHLKTEVLEDARVLAHVVTHKAYKSSDSFRVLSAGIRTQDPALFQAALEAVAGWSRDESTYYMQHTTASVMSVLLHKDFRNATGEQKRRAEMADAVFVEIGNTARKGREQVLPSLGMAR